MKSIILNLALILIVAVNTAQASNDPRFVTNETKTFRLLLNEWKGSDVEVKIVDNHGIIVMSEVLTMSENPVRKYNLKNLEEGSYTVRVSNAYKKMVQPVELDENKVVINKNEAIITYKPVINISDRTVDLNFLTLGENANVTFTDASNQVLKSMDYKNETKIIQRFNIEKLESGVYYINVSTRDGSFSKTINK